jgi:poly(hydroxyalkanoate) depolymerase family esterase
MSPDFHRLMNEATRLTRTGDLRAATDAIKAALFGGTARETDVQPDDSNVIEVEAREVPDARATRSDRPHAPARSADADDGIGSFIAGSFRNSAGHRDYKLFIPPGAGTRPMPLIVMLHGCTQNPDDFAAGTRMNEAARAQGFFVLYPGQSQRANPHGCWNWFKHNHQVRGRGEPAVLEGMTRDVMAKYAVDPDRVYVAGLSAGGAMAAILGDAYPELYSAVGVHSGLATGAASDLPSALQAMKGRGKVVSGAASGMPTIVFHGDADGTVNADNGKQVIEASVGLVAKLDVVDVATPGERHATRRLHRDGAGRVVAEHWLVHGAAHAWSGGSSEGSYTDSSGPSATREMLRFFFEHPRRPSVQ